MNYIKKKNKEEPTNPNISRRKAISNALAIGAVVGVGVVSGLGGYLMGSSSGSGRVETVTVGGRTVTVGGQTVTVTNTVTATVTGQPTQPKPVV
ncbi:MAG: hypothetical protein NZ581_08140, partial [Candidatus Caldarchaeum sp.]|nr:hypothetical protein [Candidatus Caldarchaeum sp.]MDW8436143.1 hypothetical protein [Candidatus Caldarchaeum sp.]